MPITEFSATDIREVRADIETALEIVGRKYGIEIKTAKCTYGSTGFKLAIEGGVIQNGVGVTPSANNFVLYGRQHGFTQEDLGRSFFGRDGSHIVITGWNTRAHKMPIMFTSNGQRRKASVNWMLTQMGRPTSARGY